MVTKYYPGLNTDGWITSPAQVLDACMADFYMSEASQDYIFAKGVSSLPNIIQENNGYMVETSAGIRGRLTEMLQKYFEIVEVTAEPVENEKDLMAGIITVFVKVTRDGEMIQLNNLLKIAGTRLEDVRDAISGKSVLNLGA